MTLHWWMHWFWVTVHFAVIIAIPAPSTTERTRVDHNVNNSWRNVAVRMTTDNPNKNFNSTEELPMRSSMRIPKAINFYPPSIKKNPYGLSDNPPMFRPSTNASRMTKSPRDHSINRSDDDDDNINNSNNKDAAADDDDNDDNINGDVDGVNDNVEEDINDEGGGRSRVIETSRVFHPINGRSFERMEEEERDDLRSGQFFQHRQNTRITWIWTTMRPSIQHRKKNDDEINEKFRNLSTDEEKDLTVLPLRLEERIKVTVNRTRTITSDGEHETDLFSTRTINGSEDIEIDQVAEPRISSATAVPVLHANLAESTRLSRARNTFRSDFQRDRAEDRSFHVDDDDDVIDNRDNGVDDVIGGVNAERNRTSVTDIAAITGSCLAMVILISSIASLGFVMYRRRYLNPPQTLNSDKCSNPDSSGYIDDSTIRDNSEEMYSLDNDSFLNSLEAMTIQNYWTDSVKHTKL